MSHYFYNIDIVNYDENNVPNSTGRQVAIEADAEIVSVSPRFVREVLRDEGIIDEDEGIFILGELEEDEIEKANVIRIFCGST